MNEPPAVFKLWVGLDMYTVMLTKTPPEEPEGNTPVLGRCDPDNRVILVLKRQDGLAQLQSLIHEMIHAIEAQMGQEIDEGFVRILGHGLGQTIWQNLAWLAETTLAGHPDVVIHRKQRSEWLGLPPELTRPEGS